MPFDFDPFQMLDMNHDLQVDASDLQSYELQQFGTFSLTDLDHDLVMDRFDMDMNNDALFDKHQMDLNHNMMIDKFEKTMGFTKFKFDINGDGVIDHLDEALAKSIYNL